MLDKLFLQILNMSITASFVILFVLIARLFLKKSPKTFSYALWGAVLFRLICPFSFESMFSLLPTKANPISQDIVYAPVPKIDMGIPAINDVVNSSLPAATPDASINPLQVWVFLGRVIWLVGIAILLIYSIVSLLKLQKCLSKAVHEGDNIYLVDQLDTPFVMGIIRPKIYLPTALGDEEKQYILLHEQTHIRRLDHVIKILSFFVLCLHWFNPLVWVAFFASVRDMEMSCDEMVIKQLGNDVKKGYSSSLLALTTGRPIIGGTPLAFGEGDTKGRIKNVLNYKGPRFWVTVVAVISIIAVSIGLVANPMDTTKLSAIEDFSLESLLGRVTNGTLISENRHMDFNEAKAEEIAYDLKELKVKRSEVSKRRDLDRDSTNQIHFVFRGLSDNGYMGNIYFNFTKDFSEVWVDNDVKPSFSYTVKKPDEVKYFFEQWFGSVTQAIEVGSAEELWKSRTKYIGDNSAVGNIINGLQFPSDVIYDSFELYTSEHPYTVIVNFKSDTETRKFYSASRNQLSFYTNALTMFSLIENVEGITFKIDDGVNPYSLDYTSSKIKMILGEEYFKESETLDGFNTLLEKINGYGKGNETDNKLTFTIKPDEPAQVFGEVAAMQWLNSYKDDNMSETKRILDYTINDIIVVEVDMVASDAKMHGYIVDDYIVNINYGITTATENYLAPEDGISGKGTFDGLFRKLYVRSLGSGYFEIIGVETGK